MTDTDDPDTRPAQPGELESLRTLADAVLDVLLSSGRELPGSIMFLADAYDEYNDTYGEVSPSLCADCGTDTTPKDGPWEYYMVHAPLWEKATGELPARFLCIGCLEFRLGFQLSAGDFTHARINDPSDETSSARLLDRLQASRPTRKP